MKRFKSTNMKIIAATAMTIFSLFAATIGVFAWFTGRVSESKNADEFEVTVNNGRFKNLYFHKSTSTTIDSTTLKPTSYTFESDWYGKLSYDWSTHTAAYTKNTGAGDSVKMNDYTPLDFSQPILLVFELNDAYELTDAGEISIDARTDVERFLGERDSTGAAINKLTRDYYKLEDSVYYFALSSVINFYCNDSSAELYNKVNNENSTLINTTYSAANLQSKEDSIAEKTEDPDAVVPDLTFTYINNDTDETSFNKQPSIYKSKANTTVKYISIVVDYYSDALDYIYSTYLGDADLENSETFDYHLEFLCDWGLEIN